MSTNKRISRAFKNAKKLPLNKESKYILFSDCHRGDNSFADDFARNKKVYNYALTQYLKDGFTYIELGDGDELWENSFKSIFNANKDIFLILKQFYDKNQLFFIWGNHDMDYKKPKNITKNLSYFYDSATNEKVTLMPNASYSESIRLENDNGQSVLLLHGHQADWFNYSFWKLSRFLVRFLWKPLQIIGVKDPTSPAQNFKELLKVERRIEKWIRNNNNQMIIAGHTHRPRFPKTNELPYFNNGSCVHPRCITGIEIASNKITLIKWFLTTHEDGTMQIIKEILEKPQKINDYIN